MMLTVAHRYALFVHARAKNSLPSVKAFANFLSSSQITWEYDRDPDKRYPHQISCPQFALEEQSNMDL
jgi:hypothetical protein